jgi:hypothetical protein
MDKILIDDLLEDKWSCPFNRNTLEILMSNEESSILIQQFVTLCQDIEYVNFSSPGNSFERKLIGILNRKYILDRFNGPCSIRAKCASNQIWLSTYDHLIDMLRINALAIQFKTLKNSASPFIQVTDDEIIAKYKSDVLNEEGVTAAYRMFLEQM